MVRYISFENCSFKHCVNERVVRIWSIPVTVFLVNPVDLLIVGRLNWKRFVLFYFYHDQVDSN